MLTGTLIYLHLKKKKKKIAFPTYVANKYFLKKKEKEKEKGEKKWPKYNATLMEKSAFFSKQMNFFLFISCHK